MTLQNPCSSALAAEVKRLREKVKELGKIDAAAEITFKSRGKKRPTAAYKRVVKLKVKRLELKATHVRFVHVVAQFEANSKGTKANIED